ncbi:MAG TPA: SIMPL domain-containing protein [Phenylobacterium sp.]|uniref:SIMPL domain-containing protein n=1 Tax=Phenylobacterium sp. TaxID=1871053 RepID=UPI002B46A82C|nr:SIMPL domain-containing protein [Phenylobacterium sp.]HKR89014.1 SIMPL domain-containing protein [Phenylobacterium sp.]
MQMPMRAAALSLALVLGTGAAPAAFAQAAPGPGAADAVFRATTLGLGAYGETRLAPDIATISLGVMTEARTAQAAMQANAARMGEVLAALKRGGIAAKDIQTSQLSIEPQYAYEQNQPPRLTGYRASNQVTVTVRDLTRLGTAVDATVSAGANQVGGISFGLADPTAAENAARELAVKALTAKADLYARATGHRVLRLVSLSEGAAFTPPQPVPMVAMASARFKEADTQVSPGEIKVRVDVSGVYELAR